MPQNLVVDTEIWSLRLIPRVQIGFNFWGKSLRLVPQNASCKLFVGTGPCDQIKTNQSQIGITSPNNSLRILFQDGGSQGRRRLERQFHQNADRLLQKYQQFWDKNHKDKSSKSKTNKVLSPLVAKFDKSSVFCFCVDRIWSATKRYYPLIFELNQKQFKHWIISLKNLWFVLSWFISMLHCYFHNFDFLRKLQNVRMMPFAPQFFLLSCAIGSRL